MCCYLVELLLLIPLLLLMFIATSAATCYCFIVQLSPRYCHYYVLLLPLLLSLILSLLLWRVMLLDLLLLL